jgi:hypothetical protein
MDGRRRLAALLVAGLIDSFGLAVGWTAFMLAVVATQGLGAASLYGAAMLFGIGLSAPLTGRVALRLDGRRLLQTTALGEGALRIASFLLLLHGAPSGIVALSVAVGSMLAWTGFAGMRAEVAAAAPTGRARALTWYAGGIAAIEAAGMMVAALLPVGTNGAPEGWLLVAVITLYGCSLLPTLWVARGAVVPRRPRQPAVFKRHAGALGGALVVTALAAGPALLGVALATDLYGRVWVAPAAAAFMAGALLAPVVVGRVERLQPAIVWPALGAVLAGAWILAAWEPLGLVLAQLASGVALSALDGLFDARVARGEDDTTALAWAASARSLGGAAGVAAVPALIAFSSLAWVSAGLALLLVVTALAGAAFVRVRQRIGASSTSPLVRSMDWTATTIGSPSRYVLRERRPTSDVPSALSSK